MVDDYRLTREAQLQAAEGVFRQDEDYRATTFKEWLQAFEWESARERYEQDAAARDGARHDEHEAREVPTEGAAEDTAEAERAQQLARWHTDDHEADERGTADLADLYGRSA